jgi:malate dehydrogenase (oxaloacetate-decarboxylating)
MKKIAISQKGEELLNDPLLNKGTAFTLEEREEFGIRGFLPYHVSTIEEQVKRRYGNFQQQCNELAKYLFLSSLQNRNEILFYRLVLEHVQEMLPYIYTPTVGAVSIHYSSLYREHRGLYLPFPIKDKIEQIIMDYPRDNVDVIVVTDGERILGLGDLGVGGMTIPVGKLSLYTLFGGIHPAKTLPVLLDVGTNNAELLKDPLYIGWRHERIRGKEYNDFVEVFVKAIKKRYPNVLLQWEDFAKPNAKPLLDRYRDQICSFNDDIQGTAAVALAAVLAAVKLSRAKLADQRIAVFGAGSAGIGICGQILNAMLAEGMKEEEALKCFYVVDIKGLIHTKLEGVDENQKHFAQDYQRIASWEVADRQKITLLDVVKNAHPTVLIGVSTQAGAFTQEIVTAMAHFVDRPVIFPLSNPTSKSEAQPKDLLEWTKGEAIIATGSPFSPVVYQGKTYHIAQCNNVYIFPGVGLGIIASKAKRVPDSFFLSAAQVLSEHSPMLKEPYDTLFPAVENLRKVARNIGLAVAKKAQEEGLAPKVSEDEMIKRIDETMWYPEYPLYTLKN